MRFKYMIKYEVSYGYPDSEREFVVFSEDTYETIAAMIRDNIKQIADYKDAVIEPFDFRDDQASAYFNISVQDQGDKHTFHYHVSVFITPVLEIKGKYFELKPI
jgi:hypothetical protein